MDTAKTFLKRIFPRVFLKKAFGFCNRIRIATFDKILFPEFHIEPGAFTLYRKGFPFRENQIDIKDIKNDSVRTYMQQWYEWTQEEFILQFDSPCYIEPDIGWAIVPPNKLIYYSLGISRTGFLKKPDWSKFKKRELVQEVASAISLRDTGEENYFHFYNDVLAKIFFLRSSGVEIQHTSFIIAKALWNKPYFQYYLQHSDLLKSLEWIVQDRQYIHSQATIFCKPLTHRRDLFDLIFQPITIPVSGNRKIYLGRRADSLRFIENGHDVEAVLRNHQYEIIYAEDLSVEQQIKIFASASHIVGIHGAGLTNIWFRNDECKVLEIFPPPSEGYLAFHYVMLAKMKGFFYDGIISTKGKDHFSGGFHVDPVAFEDHLKNLS